MYIFDPGDSYLLNPSQMVTYVLKPNGGTMDYFVHCVRPSGVLHPCIWSPHNKNLFSDSTSSSLCWNLKQVLFASPITCNSVLCFSFTCWSPFSASSWLSHSVICSIWSVHGWVATLAFQGLLLWMRCVFFKKNFVIFSFTSYILFVYSGPVHRA